MSTEFPLASHATQTATRTHSWRGFGPQLWPYRVGRTTVINALALLGFQVAPEILNPVDGGIGGDLLAIGGVAPFLLDGINGLILLLHDLGEALVWLNGLSLLPNALLWLIWGGSRRATLPWYSAVAVVPGVASLLVNWLILCAFVTLLSVVALIWTLCVGIVLVMLVALLFGTLIKRLIPPMVLPENPPAEVYN